MTDFLADMTAAAARGDLAAVTDFVAAGTDWQQDRQQPLRAALKAGQMDVAKFLLEEHILPRAETAYCRSFANGFNPTDDEVAAQVAQVRSAIHAGMTETPPTYSVTLLTLAVQYNVPGLFDTLLAQDKARTAQYGAMVVEMTGQMDFVEELLATGVQTTYLGGALLSHILKNGDMAVLENLAQHGFDFNGDFSVLPKSYAPALARAMEIKDEKVKAEALRIMLEHGADLRHHGLETLRKGALAADDTVYALAEAAEAGSQLPMLLALEKEAQDKTGAREDFKSRYPFLKHWYMYDFIDPLMTGTATGQERWFENVRMTDRGADDNFLIKAAIMSAQDQAMVPYLLGQGGVSLNTKNDRPLTLAILLNKPHLLAEFAGYDVDPYAAKGEAFHFAKKLGGETMQAALADMVSKIEKVNQKKLMKQASTGITLAALRTQSDAGETGLYMAAKAGVMPLLDKERLLGGMTADDFLAPAPTGGTVAGVLTLRGEHATLFSPNIWAGALDEAEKIYQTLSAADRKKSDPFYTVLMQPRAAAEHRKLLKEKSKGLRLTITKNPAPKNPGTDPSQG